MQAWTCHLTGFTAEPLIIQYIFYVRNDSCKLSRMLCICSLFHKYRKLFRIFLENFNNSILTIFVPLSYYNRKYLFLFYSHKLHFIPPDDISVNLSCQYTDFGPEDYTDTPGRVSLKSVVSRLSGPPLETTQDRTQRTHTQSQD